MSMYESIPQFAKMLGNLDRWLEKAMAHAKAKSFDVNVLTHARLAPDQYSLVKQVQAACDGAKFTAAYLSGQKAPSHPDTEQTVEELRARIATCIAYLGTVQEKDFAGAEDVRVSPPWMHGSWVKGDRYLTELATPNFYFHVTTAYSILRNNGVDLGKADFIGGLPMNAAS
jgi:hypothetical protein